MRSWVAAVALGAMSAGCQTTTTRATPATARPASSDDDVARWSEAAGRAQRAAAAGDRTADAPLAEALFRLGLYRGALAIVTRVAADAQHPARTAVLPWIAKLAGVLADHRALVEVASSYDSESLSPGDTADALSYLRVRRRFETRAYEPAIALASSVSPSSPFYARTLFFAAMSQVQLRRSVPAAEALNRIRALPPSALGENDASLVDVATIDLARLYYSAAITVDAAKNPVIDTAKMTTSLSYFRQVKTADLASRARFEEGWVFFMVGDHAEVEKRTTDVDLPEASFLYGISLFTRCKYDAVNDVIAAFRERYLPVERDLKAFVAELAAMPVGSRYERVQAVARGTTRLQPIAASALKDGRPARSLRSQKQLEEEQARRTMLARSLPPEITHLEDDALAAEGSRTLALLGADLLEALQTRAAEMKVLHADMGRLRIDTAYARTQPARGTPSCHR